MILGLDVRERRCEKVSAPWQSGNMETGGLCYLSGFILGLDSVIPASLHWHHVYLKQEEQPSFLMLRMPVLILKVF
jgi:hypothetical protein